MEGAIVDKTACFVDDKEGKDNPGLHVKRQFSSGSSEDLHGDRGRRRCYNDVHAEVSSFP